MMNVDRQQARIVDLLTCFQLIHRDSMRDLPIVNPALSVTAVGFRPWSTEQWDDAFLGILITPWFMNLIVLPASYQPIKAGQTGKTISLSLPAGDAQCICSSHDDIGVYLSCSLMSPVQSLASQQQASEMAEQVLSQLLTFPQADTEHSQLSSRRGFFKHLAGKQSRLEVNS